MSLGGAVLATRYVGSNSSGAPATGTFQVGDFVVNHDASIYVCVTAGTPGSWIDSATVGPSVSSVFGRTGSVIAVDGDYYGVVAAAKTGATQASRYVGATASGAPVAGTFAVGDFVIAQDGGVFVCTVAGTPGTWVAVGGSGLPTGWTQDGSNPANVNTHGGDLVDDFGGGNRVIVHAETGIGRVNVQDENSGEAQLGSDSGVYSAPSDTSHCFLASPDGGATEAMDAGSLPIVGLQDPADPQDAATKNYVDTVAGAGIPQGGPLNQDLFLANYDLRGTTNGSNVGGLLGADNAASNQGGAAFMNAGDSSGAGNSGGNASIRGGEADGGDGAAFLALGADDTNPGLAFVRASGSQGVGGQALVSDNGGGTVWGGVPSAAGVPSGAPVGTLPFAYNTTAVTGGFYFWNGAAWVKVATIL